MFTGLVVERGRLSRDPERSPRGGVVLCIEHSATLGARLQVGSSLSVAGACLTIVEHQARRSAVELSPETLARTQLGRLRSGAELNLEPALRLGDELGGHWVQGHVDGLVRLASRHDLDEHSRFTFELPRAFDRWVVEKGSVAIDGVSLTVASRDERSFDVALIPHTLSVTTLGAARPGQRLHFEGDLFAKYVERMSATRRPSGRGR